MIGKRIGHSLDPVVVRIYHLFFGKRVVSPNVLTLFGLFFSLLAAALIALGAPLLAAGVMLFLSGFCDMLDGAVARHANMVTPFGGFLDSVLDRYSDLFLMLAISIHFLRLGDRPFSMISFFAAIGVAVIPYARARAAVASLDCQSGLLERPERMILLIGGLCFSILRPVVLILAVFTHVTVLHRVLLTKKAADAGTQTHEG